jgi:hypothetical protein
MAAVNFFRNLGHDVRMVAIDRFGKAITREYEGV